MLILKTLIQSTLAITLFLIYQTYNDIKYDRYEKEIEVREMVIEETPTILMGEMKIIGIKNR